MPISEFFAQWEFFREAVFAGMISGAVLGALGVYLVARRMVFFSAALTQVSGLGVVCSLLVWTFVTHRWADHLAHDHGANTLRMIVLTGGAFLFSGLGAILLARGSQARSDQRLGLAWILATSLILVLGARVDRHEIPNITLWMFGGRGDAGLLPEGDFLRLLLVNSAVLALHLWWRRGFIAATLDPVGARVRGMPVGPLDIALLLSVGAATSIGGAVLGMLPVFAYSVLPAMSALRVTRNLSEALAVAAIVGAAAGFFGYLAAFRFALPVGASQALAAGCLAAILIAASAIYSAVGRPR